MEFYGIFRGKRVAAALCCVLAAALLFTIPRGVQPASARAASNERRIPIYCVGRGDDEQKVISLTFDAACPAG